MPMRQLRIRVAPCTMAPWPTWAHGCRRTVAPGKHMHRAVLLNIATFFDDDAAPIATDGRPRTDVDILAYLHIADDACRRVDIGRWMHRWPHAR
jgi:hypothetical protein